MKYIIITLCDFSVFYFILQILHFTLKIVRLFTIYSCSHTPSLEHVQNGPRKSRGGSVDNGISGDKPENQKRMIFQAVGPCLQCLTLSVALRGVMKQITKQALSLNRCDAGQPSACEALCCGRERERERVAVFFAGRDIFSNGRSRRLWVFCPLATASFLVPSFPAPKRS